ncbi:MAG: hypothetical protein ABWK04_03685 [Hydrogenobacter sp.]
MQRVALYKDLSLETINLEKLFGEVVEKKISGYFQISYWNSDDYLLFADGEFLWGVSISRDGARREIDMGTYRAKNEPGKVSFYEVPLVNLLIFKHHIKTPPDPYNFASYGYEFLTCVKFSHIDKNKLMEQIKRSHLDGYLVVCNKGGFILMLMFQKGLPVCLYKDNLYTTGKNQRINIEKEDAYIAVYATEPELPLLLCSMDTLKKEREDTFMSGEELSIVKKEIANKKLSALLDVFSSKGERLYEFFYKGTQLLRLLHTMDRIESHNLDISPGTKNIYSLYTIQVKESIPPIQVEFYSEELVVPEEIYYVDEERVRAIKSHFIEEIGPVGAILWNKILKEKGYLERRMREEDLRKLVEILYLEIPDSMHASRFLEKARRVLG